MITLSHAYSASNSGDGLLVDLSVAAIKDAIGPEIPITVLAMDPLSFNLPPETSVVGLSQNGGQLQLATAMIQELIPFTRPQRIAKQFASSKLVVAVGGGYMRAPGGVYSFKSFLAHTVQALIAKRSGIRRIYLPQSVGPLRGIWGRLMARALTGDCLVWARDDRSVQELQRWNVNVKRAPDLAVLEVAKSLPLIRPSQSPQRVLIVARDLPLNRGRRDRYVSDIKKMATALNAEVVVQSTKRGNDDASFYREVGLGSDNRSLKQALSDGTPSLVISVRLHGSLQAILAGTPSIHLSYERKGFGAFEDLGISEYVHNVYSFDADQVIAQARHLIEDTNAYWQAVYAQRELINRSRTLVVDSIRQAFHDASK